MNFASNYPSLHSVKNKFLLLIVLSSLFYSCRPTRHLEEDQLLLTKVKVKFKDKSVFKSDIASLSKQKPNRKLLGVFKLYLGIYNLYYNKPESKMRQNLGEEPVIYDSTQNEASVQLMTKYLQNRGFFENEVQVNAKLKKKKAKLVYTVRANERYRFKSTRYDIDDDAIEGHYTRNKDKTHVKVESPIDTELLEKERKRIERNLKNNGYFNFTKEFISYAADTSQTKKSGNVSTQIKNKTIRIGGKDSTLLLPHTVFHISKVYVRLDYQQRQTNNEIMDTSRVDSIYFLGMSGDEVRRDVLAHLIYLRPGDMYRQDLQELTYRNLANLRMFSFVNINYEEDFDGRGLTAYIDLNRRKQKSYTLETEGTNNGGNLGVNGVISFENNNAFRGGEIFNIKMMGAVEAQQLLTDQTDEQVIDGVLPFNTYEFGPELNLRIPRFVLPFRSTNISQKGNPRTNFNLSYNFQNRPDYTRSVSKSYVSYSWNESASKTHIIQPIDLSFINLTPSPEFEEVLENTKDPFLKNSYTDNLILAFKYSFILNTQTANKLKNNFYLRFNTETAGNLVSLFNDRLEQIDDQSTGYRIWGVPYAQYWRNDVDFRFYQNFEYNQIAYRFFTGLGIPYGNSISMPFEKSFYAGGANGIRAWQARQLGPGNLPDSSIQSVDQIGNFSLEGNIEHRFKITKVLEGASFIDAGNIWNLNQEDSRDETQLEPSTLWRGLAIGVGVGVRLNFNFFIFRFDFAVPVKDPAEPNPTEIKAQFENSNLNFGIGYPF